MKERLHLEAPDHRWLRVSDSMEEEIALLAGFGPRRFAERRKLSGYELYVLRDADDALCVVIEVVHNAITGIRGKCGRDVENDLWLRMCALFFRSRPFHAIYLDRSDFFDSAVVKSLRKHGAYQEQDKRVGMLDVEARTFVFDSPPPDTPLPVGKAGVSGETRRD